jgi:hypothetical protein
LGFDVPCVVWGTWLDFFFQVDGSKEGNAKLQVEALSAHFVCTSSVQDSRCSTNAILMFQPTAARKVDYKGLTCTRFVSKLVIHKFNHYGQLWTI